MPPRRSVPAAVSPDPLESNLPEGQTGGDAQDPDGDVVFLGTVSGPSTPTKRAAPRKTARTASGRKSKAADGAPSSVGKGAPGRKRKAGEEADEVLAKKQRTTPGAKASPAPRGRPSSAKKAASTPRASGNAEETPKRKVGRPRGTTGSARKTPTKAEPTTPTNKSARKTPSSMVASLKAASTSSAKPSPRGRKPKIVDAAAEEPLPSFDDAFGGDEVTADKGSTISRETFLANEALRRQREARNFVFEGDVQAPRLTRSGRVVKQRKTLALGDAEEEGEDAGAVQDDMYGSVEAGGDDQEPRPLEDDLPDTNATLPMVTPGAPSKETTAPVTDDVQPLPAGARQHVLNILATLTGQSALNNPPPFHDEDTNEVLQGLVNLLRGTVERGEGNSALVVGPRGSGKTRTVARALNLLPSTSSTSPIVVRLSGHAQTNDRLAIREIGRQIAEAEGHPLHMEEQEVPEEADGEDYAPTTLPSHLLALLTAPSPRAIIIIIEEFDLFTEHARQALLYCLLDVVQSVKTGPVETTGRGVAVVGVTTRTDLLLLLEKRVKSRFSHRIWRVNSPLSPEGSGWRTVLRRALVPWRHVPVDADGEPEEQNGSSAGTTEMDDWKENWHFAIETLFEQERVVKYLDRLSGLTTDVRTLYRPFVAPISHVLGGTLDWLTVSNVVDCVLQQVDGAGWGLQNSKLKGLPQPSLGVLVIVKHLMYAGKHEFNFAQIEDEYLRFSRTRLVGSGRARWPSGVLKMGYDHLKAMSLLVSTSGADVRPPFARVRCTLAPHEIVAWFKGEGKDSLGPEMAGWGRVMGGHA